MPEISRFYGIVIKMYWLDHPPPHFHAEYGDHVAAVEIGGGRVIEGSLPLRARRMVRQWEAVHSAELFVNWARARSDRPLLAIDPLR